MARLERCGVEGSRSGADTVIQASVDIDRFVKELSENVDMPVNLYLMGGGSMMYAGLKFFTKDIDLVVRTEGEYRCVVEAMERMGFRSIRPGAGYSRMDLSDMLEREDGYRIDLFHDRVCGKLRLSEGMASRATERTRHGGVILRSCSMEDILIFKSITERDGDLEDSKAIIVGARIDWKVFLGEVEAQVSEGEDVWITWIADRLWLLKEQAGLSVPVLDRIIRMADDFLERWESELLDRNGLRGAP